MALSASTVFEINSLATASNVNGGGFNPANANMLTDLAATVANTAAPVVTSASYNFKSTDVGNYLYIKSGTSWTPGWYKIISVAANAATLEAAIGSANVTQVVNNRYGTNTVIGCATVASPTSGTFTIDYSQSTACITSTAVSDYASTGSSTTLTSATAAFTPVMVGNLFKQNTAGTSSHGLTQWFEIVSYTNATTIVLDRTPNDGTSSAACAGKVGGALSLGSSDDAIFELAVSSTTAAARYFIKGGSSISYPLGGAVSTAASGNAVWPVIVESYVTTRGDRPSGATRPTLNCGSSQFTNGANFDWISLIFTGTNTTSTFSLGASSKVIGCKFINTSTTANANGLNASGSNNLIQKCEGISYRGKGFNIAASSIDFIDSWAHDSNVGIAVATSSVHISRSIVSSCVTTAINCSSAITGVGVFDGLTVYGAENKTGTGIVFATGTTNVKIRNCILYGFTTAVTHADVQTVGLDNFNNYFNNTADIASSDKTKWQKGSADIALDPQFTGVRQVTGTLATTSNSGNTLVLVGATFVSSGVVAGRDYVYISSTGGTAGIYGISSVDSETQLTLDLAPGTSSANVSFQITVGQDFTPGINMRDTGSLGTFPGGFTTGHMGVGAVERKELGAYVRRR